MDKWKDGSKQGRMEEEEKGINCKEWMNVGNEERKKERMEG